MRRTRIEKRQRPVRARRYQDDTRAWSDVLDPRDPDIVRAKQVGGAQGGGSGRP
ncbi:hypothetical protein [Streptomyces cylindrosporus]|uniref:Uncharacterized protein n=1 Tax=Streptomyces cylindrosporus TaxID=2927583 RepID=A0ABS9YJ19_9ACTN|nr:hypothetical protein [Streptomyces cylindrosporus]MCI3277242.1 hypothetical protein [Streptomyces cylindrosporus]